MTQSYLALLGTKGGPAIRPGSTMPTSNLLCLGGRRIVVDCGLGVARGLIDQGMELKELSLIFITHLHSDHYLELGPLIHTAWTAGLKHRVRIYGPAGLETYWASFLASMEADISLRIKDEGRPDLQQLVEIHTVDSGRVFDEEGLVVTAMRTEHPPLIDCFAFRFSGAGRDAVMSGDTAYLPPLAEFAAGADLLVHEAMLGAALEALVARVGNIDDRLMTHLIRSHTKAGDAAKIAASAGVGALALNHLIPSDDPDYNEADWQAAVAPHWNGTFYVGRDGLRIDL
ncbi:MAG: MBL fold metallo-hydrolase [Bacteroidetes bacterium]|nr:MBL fold metallo-hydrolase [Bacteroidota bacterium]